MLLVFAMKCCTKMPSCPLPHNHYCCLLLSPKYMLASPAHLYTTCLMEEAACLRTYALGWRKLPVAFVWGAVCKNIISDRFSTKTAISGRDSYLCMLSLAEIAISACRDIISGKDSVEACRRARFQRALSVRAFSFCTWRRSEVVSCASFCTFRCKKRMLLQKERAESEPFDTLQRYLCMQSRDSSFCAKSIRYNIFANGAPYFRATRDVMLSA